MSKLKPATFTFLLVLLFCSCAEKKHANEEKVAEANLTLLDPKPVMLGDTVTGDYKHCIDITGSNYLLRVDGKEFRGKNLPELTSFVSRNRSSIIKQRVNIIADSTTPYKKLVDVLDLLTETKIENYNIVQLSIKRNSSSIIVTRPDEHTAKDKSLDDASVLTITVSNGAFETTLSGSKTVQRNAAGLDKFLSAHAAGINPDKIVVKAAKETSYKQFESLVNVLKKHNYNNYKLVSTE